MKRIKAVIFDMDGVLVDTEPLYMKQVVDFYHRFGISLPYHEAARLAGSSHKESWEMMADWWKEDIRPQDMEQFYETHAQDEEIIYSEILNPYVRYILPRLRTLGIKTAIASSSPMEAIQKMLHECELQQFFDLVVTGHDFENSKPDPAIYLHTVERLQIAAKDCVILEDSTYGIEAALRAGIEVIALKDDRFHFDQSKADYQVADLLEAYHLIV